MQTSRFWSEIPSCLLLFCVFNLYGTGASRVRVRMTDQGVLSVLVLTEAVTVSADYEDMRPWLLLRTEADPGPGPAGEVEEAAPGQDLLQLGHLGLPRGCEGGAVQLLPQVEEDEVDGPVVRLVHAWSKMQMLLMPAFYAIKNQLNALWMLKGFWHKRSDVSNFFILITVSL